MEGHIFVSWLHPFKEHRLMVIGSKGMISYEDSSKDKSLKLMKSSNSIGVLRNTELLSDDPGRWKDTKKSLFSGGRYIETQDKKWNKVYSVIVSPLSCHLFNLHSYDEMNRYVFEN